MYVGENVQRWTQLDYREPKAGVWGRSPHEKKGGSRGVSPLAYAVTLWFLKRQKFEVDNLTLTNVIAYCRNSTYMHETSDIKN